MSLSVVHILLIEDDDVDAEMVYRVLSAYASRLYIVRAADGIRALEILYNAEYRQYLSDPHIILLDLHLPGFSGLEILAELRLDDLLAKIPVVILTGETVPAYMQLAFTSPVVACISKSNLAGRAQQLVNVLRLYLNRMERIAGD